MTEIDGDTLGEIHALLDELLDVDNVPTEKDGCCAYCGGYPLEDCLAHNYQTPPIVVTANGMQHHQWCAIARAFLLKRKLP